MNNIIEQLSALRNFMPVEELRKRIAAMATWMAREPDFIIPSTEIGVDGIILKSIFLVAGDLIGEIRLTDRFDNFDFMKFTVFNVSVALGMQEIKNGEQIIASYYTASVQVTHTPSIGLASNFSYAGVAPPDQWLEAVKAVIPASSMVAST